ncbi:MAG TPA: hypothetical protein ENK41_05750 [Rhodobacteraceae bacterium]|nr:hypothetical protein [Paracoccaceae bacterium]
MFLAQFGHGRAGHPLNRRPGCQSLRGLGDSRGRLGGGRRGLAGHRSFGCGFGRGFGCGFGLGLGRGSGRGFGRGFAAGGFSYCHFCLSFFVFVFVLQQD